MYDEHAATRDVPDHPSDRATSTRCWRRRRASRSSDFWAEMVWPMPGDRTGPPGDRRGFGGKVVLMKVNVDESPGLAARYGIRSIPTMLFVKDGRSSTAVGAVPKSVLQEHIERASRNNPRGDTPMATPAAPESVIQDRRHDEGAGRSHAGFRPVHAKGSSVQGRFARRPMRQPSPAPHFAGPSVAVTVRFANGSGNPDVHDGVPGVRSMAVKFPLADGRAPTSSPTRSKDSFATSRRAAGILEGSAPCARHGQARP